MKCKTTILTIFLFPFFAFGQSQTILSKQKIDSLQKLLSGSDIHYQVDILNTLAAHYAPIDFDSSIMYSAQAVRIGSVYGYPFGIGMARYNTGNAYYFNLDFKNALLSYLSALKIFEEYKFVKEAGDIYLQIGHINFFIKRVDKAIATYRKALENYQGAADESSCASVYEAMSLTMNNLNYDPIDSALIYANKLLKYSRKVHNPYREAFALVVIGQIYLTDSKSLSEKSKALAYNDSALFLATSNHYIDLSAVINLNLGCYYDRSTPFFEITCDLAKSRSYFEKAYIYAKELSNNYLSSMILNSLAIIAIEEENYRNAESCLNESEMNLNNYFRNDLKKNSLVSTEYPFQKITDFFLAQRERNFINNARYKLYKAKGETGKAIGYLQDFYHARDTMNAAQQSQLLELIMTEADAEKTDQKIRMLSQDNELSQLKLTRTRFIFAGGAAGVIILSLFLLLFFQRKKLKAEQNSHLLEQKLLRSQMNPHFIFNSLASIQNFVINQKATEASIYLSRFSTLVRNILDSSVDENVPLQKEIETIQNYLELQKVRYADQFEFSLTVDEQIDAENMMIPPMLAQPFIENSIEHGIKFKETPGHIDIRFQLEGDMIRFEVEDDGVGRERAKEIELKQKRIHRSMSTSITHETVGKIKQKAET